MKTKKKKKLTDIKARLPIDQVLFIRSHGGYHSSEKGDKGYNRNKEKSNLRKEFI